MSVITDRDEWKNIVGLLYPAVISENSVQMQQDPIP